MVRQLGFEFWGFAAEKAEFITSVRVRSALVAVKPGAVAYVNKYIGNTVYHTIVGYLSPVC
ncbi:hypothetical protein TUM17567_04420 [Citrobacter amalonaticus]|nr:hypothetical protein TUM17567_04420 [Citrobacter amalonaticus]